MSHDSTASTIVPPRYGSPHQTQPIAHPSHTIAILSVITLVALIASARANTMVSDSPQLLRYASMLLWEWLLLGAVIAGIYCRRDFFIATVIHPSRTVLKAFALALGIYGITFIVLACIQTAIYFTPLIHRRNHAIVLAMLPHTPLQFIGWFFVSLTAGICEELIFRGYLLQQFTAWMKNPAAAIFAVGAVFGCVHAYQGAAAIIPLTAMGIIYGFVVHRLNGDLRAVIIAHAVQDFLIAFFVFVRPLLDQAAPHG